MLIILHPFPLCRYAINNEEIRMRYIFINSNEGADIRAIKKTLHALIQLKTMPLEASISMNFKELSIQYPSFIIRSSLVSLLIAFDPLFTNESSVFFAKINLVGMLCALRNDPVADALSSLS